MILRGLFPAESKVFKLGGRFFLLGLAGEGAGLEAHEARDKGEGDVAGGAVTVFGNDEFGFAAFFFVFLDFFASVFGDFVFVVCLTVEEANHVGVLLDGAGFTKVRHTGNSEGVAGPVFGTTVELGKDDDGDAELFGEGFEAG